MLQAPRVGQLRGEYAVMIFLRGSRVNHHSIVCTTTDVSPVHSTAPS
jgi:hypothetical protein